jgi:DnaJ-class molecular chaperone
MGEPCERCKGRGKWSPLGRLGSVGYVKVIPTTCPVCDGSGAAPTITEEEK